MTISSAEPTYINNTSQAVPVKYNLHRPNNRAMGIETYQSTFDIFAHYGRNLTDKHINARKEEILQLKHRTVELPRDGAALPPSKVSQDATREDMKVGILGAGVGGLYAALILDSLDIKYEIIEASERTGGRLYTHKFKKEDGSEGDKYDYYVRDFFLRLALADFGIGCRSHALPGYSHYDSFVPSLPIWTPEHR